MTKFQTVLLAILSAVVAGVLYKFVPERPELAGGLAALSVYLFGWVRQHPQDKPAEKLPNPSPNTPVICALVLGSLLLAGQARAAEPQALGCLDTANTYCVVPAAAVGWQINLKDGTMANAVSLVGLTLQHTYGSLPLGIGVYGGLGASSANRGSYQTCGGISITSWGLLCGGVQRLAGEGVWQGMLTLAGQLTSGGTPAYVREAR